MNQKLDKNQIKKLFKNKNQGFTSNTNVPVGAGKQGFTPKTFQGGSRVPSSHQRKG